MLNYELEQNLIRPACQIDNYSYRHLLSNKWAVQQISFSSNQGETIAVFGESGSGKTTLLTSIAGLNHHFFRGGKHEGQIFLFGENVAITDIGQLTRNYGLVSQDFRNQLLAENVTNSIAFPMENQAIPYAEMHQRVEQILEMLGLSSLKGRDVNQLSGGEGQAVVIAAMLAKDPRIMIFDDVVSDLDQKGQVRIRGIISQLKKQGITMFIVDSSSPHWLLEEAADKVLILDQGQQLYFGTPEEIQQNGELMGKIGAYSPAIEFREPMNSPIAVLMDNVSYAYNGNLAVDSVSCKISKGSITGIIGHNGSGKTTLAKMIAGLYKPQSGKITLSGKEPYKLPAEQAVMQVAYSPQSTAGMFFTDTVSKELAYTPKAIRLSNFLSPETFGLAGLENEHPEFLSTGQRQKLALGCALSSDPQIIILDEPTKGLNQNERRELVDQLLKLQISGKTIVLISHDWPMIARASNNLLVMDHGRLVANGPTCEVLQDHDFFEKLGLPLPW